MPLESVTEIARWTGRAKETITKICKNAGLKYTPGGKTGRANLYETTEVLPLLFDAVNPDELDLTAERARLAHHQANKTALDEDVMRGKLVPVEQVERHWSEMVAASRAKLLALPQRIAQVAIAGRTIREIEESCRNEVYEALNELAGGIPPVDAGLDATTDDDSGGVGGAETIPEPRGKRRARKVEKRTGAAHRRANGESKPV